VWEACDDGDEVEVDVERAVVRNLSRGIELQAAPWTEDMLAIVRAGGLLPVLRQRLGLS
jgi:3-isopropylmalate/(R)-2-methylmalate dehydratase small subunit